MPLPALDTFALPRPIDLIDGGCMRHMCVTLFCPRTLGKLPNRVTSPNLLALPQMQRQGLGAPTMRESAFAVIRKDGVAGLWRGTIATMWRVGLGMGVYFFCLNHFKVALVNTHGGGGSGAAREKQNSVRVFLTGCVCGPSHRLSPLGGRSFVEAVTLMLPRSCGVGVPCCCRPALSPAPRGAGSARGAPRPSR